MVLTSQLKWHRKCNDPLAKLTPYPKHALKALTGKQFNILKIKSSFCYQLTDLYFDKCRNHWRAAHDTFMFKNGRHRMSKSKQGVVATDFCIERNVCDQLTTLGQICDQNQFPAQRSVTRESEITIRSVTKINPPQSSGFSTSELPQSQHLCSRGSILKKRLIWSRCKLLFLIHVNLTDIEMPSSENLFVI